VSNAHVVIVGAGFAGLTAAKHLGNRPGIQVTLIDRRNHHLFQPLLYQVATAGLSAAEIAVPIRSLLSRFKNITVLMGNVHGVSLKEKIISYDGQNIRFDHLILACGATHSYFNHPQWEEFAPGLKTVEQALEIRRRVLWAFEQAEMSTDINKQHQLLTCVVVGGGPTGVELAGALAELTRTTLSQDFRNIKIKEARIILMEAGPRILAGFSEKLALKAKKDLEKLGVEVLLSSAVSNISEHGVTVENRHIPASTVLWAAGVLPSPMNRTLQVPCDRSGRVCVAHDLSIPQYPDIFVLGDQACVWDQDHQTPLPGLAPVAIQQGRWAAKALIRQWKGQPRGEFRYVDKGQAATIGKRKAIVQIGSVQFAGRLAWYTWLLIHIYFLVGFHNRVFVLLQWAYSYFTSARGARLITNKEWRNPF